VTMFTRNDKAPEPTPRPTETTRETPMTTTPSQPDAVRSYSAPQPTAQSVGSANVSVISRALKITGQLESTENIQIDGEIEGDVRAVTVKVGSNAKVKGSVYGEEVELAGTVDGKIEAKKVVLTSSAKMTGDVIHQDITIHSGAYISGHCRPEFGKSENRQQPSLVKPKEPTVVVKEPTVVRA
jgi:cytoskeletal protein CcmA (bactofilin family)